MVLETEIFAPCAASRLITQDQIDQMIDTGLEVISCGANVPFADKEIFFGSIMEHTDNKVSLIPDFISNCGMARVFAYFMERKVQMTDEAIFNDTSEIIRKAIQNVYDKNQTKTGISATAFEIALTQLSINNLIWKHYNFSICFRLFSYNLEHSIKIDKLIPALVMMAISWALISLGIDSFPQWFDSANHGL